MITYINTGGDIMKKSIKKELLSLVSSLTLMLTQSACSISQSPDTEFETYHGTRNLVDYKDFLEEQGIDYSDCYVESNDNEIFIFEKRQGYHIVTESNETFDSIAELYSMDKKELLNINFISDEQSKTMQLEKGKRLKIYYYKIHSFTLDELDSHSMWEYYVIMPGDTLSEIADKYGVLMDEIRKDNYILDSNDIKAYTTIKIRKNQDEKTLD